MSRQKNIFTKLFVTYFVIILISFFLFNSIFLYLFHVNMYDDFKEGFAYSKEKIEAHFELADSEDWSEELLDASLDISLSQMNNSIYIYNSSAERVYQSSYDQAPKLQVDRSMVEDVLRGAELAEGMRVDNRLVYTIAEPIDVTAGTPHVMVMVYYELDHQYKQVLIMIGLTFTITMALTGFILWFISRRLTAPLREMNRIALQLAKGDFSQHVRVNSKDEIGQLGSTFNYMAKELENIEQMRTDFITNVSHDLRSPLTSIKGFLTALLDGTIADHRKNHYYTIMKNETERLSKLVNDLLDMSQLQHGHITIKPTTYNLSEQVRLVAAKMEPQLQASDLFIELEEGAGDVYVFADKDRIEQVLINLIENAIHHSPPKKPVYVHLLQEAEQVKVSIEDFGEGIKEEDLTYIWERFYKTDKARSKKTGTGVGLSIVKSIIDLHQSSIQVKSEVGIGTTFIFTLPQSNSKDIE
ncbi:HAMP domain-containing sensor histidine kinase [Alkalihalophilus pseudofirmus]|uniref:histidine kinase n=1 Tax=Alkalihalophilus pseudofirmus TaxID=79885 RepID=A0AAJ2NQV2_ALKPS|nr:HAMP domain-containing sensor histidine kinase [Alkalihalophilus pseudofirmus]MDV2886687.1 HAMP domain-containing sensor histidine kinase [Alkalihalophilus pseudofirmus]